VVEPPPKARNDVWAVDFVFDACADGRQIKSLTVVDEYTHESLAIDVAGSIRANRVVDVLARLVSAGGAPRYIRSDNGLEFVSKALLRWTKGESIDTAFIDPGQALAERSERELQQPLSRRVPLDGVVPQPHRSCRGDRDLETALQRGQAALFPRLPYAE
jgi:transposase InsO family protein